MVIPTYNERENLLRLVPRILQQSDLLDVLIVDDGSPDGTAVAAEELAKGDGRVAVLVRHGKLGYGSACIAGFRHALERGYPLVIQMDADLSHDPEHLEQFLKGAREYDVVQGSRYLGGIRIINWSLRRLLLSSLANSYARSVTRLAISDLTGGFRCYRRAVLERIDLASIRSNGYGFQIEMLYRAARLRFRIGETPIVFVERRSGASKMSLRIMWEAAWMVWRLRVASLIGRI